MGIEEFFFGSLELLLGAGFTIAIIFATIVLYKYFDNKYPPVFFNIYEQNVLKRIRKRLIGSKVVPDDILSIVLHGDKMVGENINHFTYIYEDAGSPFLQTIRKVYLAKQVGGALFPIKYNPNTNDLEGQLVSDAKDMVIKYANEMEITEEELKNKNKFMEIIFSSIPFLIFVIAFGGISLLFSALLLNGAKEILNEQKAMTQQLQDISIATKETVEANKELLETIKSQKKEHPILENETIKELGKG